MLETGDVVGFDTVTVLVDGVPTTVAVAGEPETRARGLTSVENLGDLDGMLFTWGGETVRSRFTMRNTLIPLRIAFYDSDGVLVDTFVMEPCTAGECDPYAANGPYAYAIEFPADRAVPDGSRLELDSGG